MKTNFDISRKGEKKKKERKKRERQNLILMDVVSESTAFCIQLDIIEQQTLLNLTPSTELYKLSYRNWDEKKK